MGKHYVMFTIEDSKTLKHRKDLMGKRKEVQDLYSGLNLFKKLAVSPWITWFISSSEKSSCCQTWPNSQDDNYFPSKWWKVVILTISSALAFLKVHIFWEGHKILRNLHQFCVLWTASQTIGRYFAKFCGPLRIYELYQLEINHVIQLPTTNYLKRCWLFLSGPAA